MARQVDAAEAKARLYLESARLEDTLVDTVRRAPLKSLTIALAAGVLFGASPSARKIAFEAISFMLKSGLEDS
jgi:hypothetical protein